jgi:predicted nucleotidyltransferase
VDFNRIFSELNKNGVKYLVAGGVAVNLHGYVRATADLDIMLLMTHDNIEKYIGLIKAMGFKPRVPVPLDDFADDNKRREWISEKGMLVFSVYNPSNLMEGLDVMIEEHIRFDEAYERRKVVTSQGVVIPVISIQDLIKLKETAGRERDLIDIDALKEIISDKK